MRFNKSYSIRVIAGFVCAVFLFVTTTYGLDSPNLRVPRADHVRLEKALEEIEVICSSGDFLMLDSREDILCYFKSKGIILEFRKGVEVSLQALKNMVYILNILPQEHLPKKIIIKQRRLFYKEVIGYRPHIFKKKTIYLYNEVLLKQLSQSGYGYVLVHEIAHTIKSSLQRGFWDISWSKFRRLREFILVTAPLSMISISLYAMERILEDFPIHMPSEIPLILTMTTAIGFIFQLYLWFKTDKQLDQFITSNIAPENFAEDFTETYAVYVLNGPYFRQKMQDSEVLCQKYNYMKKYVFDDIEYGRDANRKIVILSEVIKETVERTKKEMELYGDSLPQQEKPDIDNTSLEGLEKINCKSLERNI